MEERQSFEGLLSRPLAPSVLTSPSDLAGSIFCSFPLSFKLFLSFPIFPWAFSFCFSAGKVSLYPGPSCSERRKPSLFEARLRNRSSSWRWSVSCICTYSLSHAHSPCTHLSLLALCCLITAFAAVLIFPAAHGVCLYPYYKNLISLDRSTTIYHQKEELPFEQRAALPDLKWSWKIFWQKFVFWLEWEAHSQWRERYFQLTLIPICWDVPKLRLF